MKVNYDMKKDRFSIVGLTSGEAGALSGALSFAIDEKKRQGMYEITSEEGMLEIVKSVTGQLVMSHFMNCWGEER